MQRSRLTPKQVVGFGQIVQASEPLPEDPAAHAAVPTEVPPNGSGTGVQSETAQDPVAAAVPGRPVIGEPSLPPTDHEPAELIQEPDAPADGAPAENSQPSSGRHYKLRTSDMVPVKVKAKVRADQKRGLEASTLIVLAFGRAIHDGQIPRLVAGYRGKGQQTSPFGPHVRARQTRGTTTTRLQYNPWDYEDDGIKKLVEQYEVSRAVLVSLVLAYHYGLDPAIV
jgi:hypothetical protein